MADQKDEWIEAGGQTGEMWDPEATKEVMGVLKSIKSDVGPNNSKIYVLQEDGKDETTGVWGSTVLDTRMEEVPVNSIVKIEYLGRVKGKSPQPYKDFKVLYKAPEKTAVDEVFPDAEAV